MMLVFEESVTERKSELSLTLDQPANKPAQAYSQMTLIGIVTTCSTFVVSVVGSLTTQGSSSSSAGLVRWRTRRHCQQAQLYKLFVASSLSCQLANADKARCRKARPWDRVRELEARCAVQWFRFSNTFINLYGYIYFFSCFSFLLQIDAFLFPFLFWSSNWLIDFLRFKSVSSG